jgi:threonine aldolase
MSVSAIASLNRRTPSPASSAAFVISGTMGNLVSVLTHTHHGQELILERDAHLFWTEVAGIAAVGGLLVNRVAGTNGIMAAEDGEAIRRQAPLPRDGADLSGEHA